MMIRNRARSSDRMNRVRPSTAQVKAHGMQARPTRASKVPTALACSDAHRSPWISRAKLVVMPHDGQGSPHSTLKVQGGRPSCRCVSIRFGWPLAS
jgi:hypothetical protein